MADYINKDILCQAYIHIDPVPIDEEEFDNFKEQLELFLSTRGKFFVYEEVDTSVEFKDGSLKVYASIFGAIYLAIGQYGSFRSGVNFLASDVKRLSETIVSESLFLTKSRHESIVRVEARIGVAGSLKNIVDEIDYIKSQAGKTDAALLAKRMDKLKESIVKMIGNLNDPKDDPYIKENLEELIEKNIPANPIPLPKKPLDQESKDFYYSEGRQLLDVVKA